MRASPWGTSSARLLRPHHSVPVLVPAPKATATISKGPRRGDRPPVSPPFYLWPLPWATGTRSALILGKPRPGLSPFPFPVTASLWLLLPACWGDKPHPGIGVG